MVQWSDSKMEQAEIVGGNRQNLRSSMCGYVHICESYASVELYVYNYV